MILGVLSLRWIPGELLIYSRKVKPRNQARQWARDIICVREEDYVSKGKSNNQVWVRGKAHSFRERGRWDAIRGDWRSACRASPHLGVCGVQGRERKADKWSTIRCWSEQELEAWAKITLLSLQVSMGRCEWETVLLFSVYSLHGIDTLPPHWCLAWSVACFSQWNMSGQQVSRALNVLGLLRSWLLLWEESCLFATGQKKMRHRDLSPIGSLK